MGRPVLFDLTTGGGSTSEFFIGTVTIESLRIHTNGPSVVLPEPATLPLVNGIVVHPDVQPSPDGPEPYWAYRITITSGITKNRIVTTRGVPDGTTQINFKDLPEYQQLGDGVGPTVEYLVGEALAGDPAIEQAAQDAITTAIAAGNFKSPGMFARVLLTSKNTPDFDTASNTLVFPDSFRIYSGTSYYTVPAQSVSFASLIGASTQILIVFNTTTQALSAIGPSQLGPTYASSLLVATITNAGFGFSPWMGCPFTKNGKPFIANIRELLLMKTVPGHREVPEFVNGVPSRTRYYDGASVIRSDTYTFTATSINEVRTHVPSGQQITLITNLTTLNTEVS